MEVLFISVLVVSFVITLSYANNNKKLRRALLEAEDKLASATNTESGELLLSEAEVLGMVVDMGRLADRLYDYRVQGQNNAWLIPQHGLYLYAENGRMMSFRLKDQSYEVANFRLASWILDNTKKYHNKQQPKNKGQQQPKGYNPNASSVEPPLN